MKGKDQICNKAFVGTLRESPEIYKELVKSIPDSADYFRKRWEEDFGTIVDVSSFTDEETIDATFEINKLRTSEVTEEDKMREMVRILRIDSSILH